ncbi:ABC transporter permease [Chitinophaga varians]|uniref:ABC transporter permease n=1 Tax=Chitinophaga varians TaxID=2202339 RepID=A0A847RLI5_9BACT|nr:ABC transporter permease [Chitinophaga varians]NLR67869.1 ABC transporter permease [Chitinophaga varians]
MKLFDHPIWFLLNKEIILIRKSVAVLVLAILLPIIQLLVLPFAARYEISNIRLVLISSSKDANENLTTLSKIHQSRLFNIIGEAPNFITAKRIVDKGDADGVLHLRRDADIVNTFVAFDAINMQKAIVADAYLNSILEPNIMGNENKNFLPTTYTTMRYNPMMDYTYFTVPGILAFLVTMLGVYLSALTITAEVESGTIHQLFVTPVSKIAILLSKQIPIFLICVFVFTSGLILMRYFYGIKIQGSIALIFAFLFIYILAIIGVGLVISLSCKKTIEATVISFFLMLLSILTCGLFFPRDTMPQVGQIIADYLNPVTHFVEFQRSIILKNCTFTQVAYNFVAITILCLISNFVAYYLLGKNNR